MRNSGDSDDNGGTLDATKLSTRKQQPISVSYLLAQLGTRLLIDVSIGICHISLPCFLARLKAGVDAADVTASICHIVSFLFVIRQHP